MTLYSLFFLKKNYFLTGTDIFIIIMGKIILITILVILYPFIKNGVNELVDDLLFTTKGVLLLVTLAVAKIIRISKKIYERIKKHI